jgi:hypothetical protein
MFLCGGRWVSVFNHSVLSKEIDTRKSEAERKINWLCAFAESPG